MKNMMSYKDYFGSVNFSEEDETFFGKMEFIRSLVSYEGKNVQDLKASFHEAVDDYIETCHAMNQEPEKPFKGSFNVRVGSNLHRQAIGYAHDHQTNLNQLTKKALEEFLEKNVK